MSEGRHVAAKDEGSVPLLAALMHDAPQGRQAVRGHEVDLRIRTFAAYALGLIAERDVSNNVRRSIAAHLPAQPRLGDSPAATG